MFRTVTITRGETISIVDNWLIITLPDGSSMRVPVGDLYSIVLDNKLSRISQAALTLLAQYGVHTVICDDKHLPCGVMLPLNQYYRPLTVLRKQTALLPEFKDMLWLRIVKYKLNNQRSVLSFIKANQQKIIRLEELASEVLPGDPGNREAIGAKLYFRTLFGTNFLRTNDDGINACLNYGYSILRSAISRSLVAYGYNCALGLHHIGEFNPFNLADDLIEPLRPLVDYWVDQHKEDVVETLTHDLKISLVDLVNSEVQFNGKIMKMHNALDFYVSSLTTSIDKQDSEYFKIPILIDNYV